MITEIVLFRLPDGMSREEAAAKKLLRSIAFRYRVGGLIQI